MTDLNIPNLNKNSDKFFFKKKLSLRRKSKRKLINESFIMLSLVIFLSYLIYVIPDKISLFNNLLNNFSNIYINFLVSLTYFYDICLAIFIIVSLTFSIILILGIFSRLRKVAKRKSRKVLFK